jgi:excisionase family DNA binding protein
MVDYKPNYPFLEALVAQLGLTLKGRYTLKDAAQILGVSIRTLQDRIRNGKLRARNLTPYRFLSDDLEDYLRCSVITRGQDAE